jgi:RES domain-containing protein
MLLHRICVAEFGRTAASAFSGQGGIHGSGRWHHRGRLIVYTATHRSLALLEILVHLDVHLAIRPLVAWQIEVPAAHIDTTTALPRQWKTDPERTRDLGDGWLLARQSPALLVPSAIVPSEHNVLLNPAHPDFRIDWVTKGPEPVEIDPRLL